MRRVAPPQAGQRSQAYRRVGERLSTRASRSWPPGSRGYGPTDERPTDRIFMHRRSWSECPHLPPTGSSGLPWCWHPRPSCMPRGARHPGGEADRWSRCSGRAAGTPAGTSGCRRGSGTGSGDGGDVGREPRDPQAIRGRGKGTSQGSSSGPRLRQMASPRSVAVESAGCGPGRRGTGRCGCLDRPRPCPGITLGDKGG